MMLAGGKTLASSLCEALRPVVAPTDLRVGMRGLGI